MQDHPMQSMNTVDNLREDSMTKAVTIRSVAAALALFAAAGLGATGAAAQSTPTYVSGTATGDAGTCPRTAPCKTFEYAQSQTVADGTIICVDAGYYGTPIITKSLTIDCQAGGGSANAVQIRIAAPGAFVKLLHVGIDGLRGTTPLLIDGAAAVHLDHVVITGSSVNQAGIYDHRTGPGQLIIKNTLVNLNFGPGILVVPGGGSTLGVVLDNVTLASNTYGVAAGAGARIMIKRSVISGNTTAGVEADASSFYGINDTLISNNSTGIIAGAGSSVAVSNSDINSNSTAFSGAWFSNGNNRVFANPVFGTAPTPAGGASSVFGQF